MKVLNAADAATLLGRTVPAIYHLVARRKIPFHKDGRRLVFIDDELQAHVRALPSVTTYVPDAFFEPPPLIVALVLDETGSMDSIKEATIAGYNIYVESLKKPGPPVLFTLVKFNATRTVLVYDATPITQVGRLDAHVYKPDAMTPLYDAIVKTIFMVDERQSNNVVFVIQTDGEENASSFFWMESHERSTYTRRKDALKSLAGIIKERQARGWQFLYLGAGIDAWGHAKDMNISADTTLSYDRDKSVETFGSLAWNTASYRVTGQASSLTFTGEQRKESGEEDVISSRRR